MPEKKYLVNPGLKSLVELTPRIDNFFLRRSIPKWEFWSPAIGAIPSGEERHVIFLADTLKNFHHLYQFPNGRFHLWVLCQSLRNILCEGFGFPEAAVSVIPRYELFPPAPLRWTWNEVDHFVYAGRAVFGKNENLLRDIARACGMPLLTMGPGLPQDRGIHWADTLKGKPAFITLSHYIYEDFSVAAAQAQQNGIPVIRPDWFGLKDVTGEGVIGLSTFPSVLTDRFESAFVTKQWVEELKSIKKPRTAKLHREQEQIFIESTGFTLAILKNPKLSQQCVLFFGLNTTKNLLDNFEELLSYLT